MIVRRYEQVRDGEWILNSFSVGKKNSGQWHACYHAGPLKCTKRIQPSGASRGLCSTPAGAKKYMPLLISFPFSSTSFPLRTMAWKSEGCVCPGSWKPLSNLPSKFMAPASSSRLNTLTQAPFDNCSTAQLVPTRSSPDLQPPFFSLS